MIGIASRRMLAVVSIAGLIVVAGGSYGLASAFGSTGPSHRVVSHEGRYVDPRFGWTIRVPTGMVAGHFHSNGMDTNDGVRISNFAPNLDHSGGTSPPVGWLRSMPADGVAVQIWFEERIPTVPPLRDAKLPLPRQSFQLARGWPYVGGLPAPLYRTFFADGFPFAAAVWFGPRASRSDRQAIWRVVRSLHFPPLQEGTFWQGRYYVLRRASRYPTGSVTLVPSSSLPHTGSKPESFYLIHAPRAFYAIKQIFGLDTQPFTTCKMAFDRQAFQFFCPGTDLRWDRVGRPIGPRAGSQDWMLPLIPATVAHDGHILFSPFFGGVLGVDLNGSPWA
jgi:hypothetical protein